MFKVGQRVECVDDDPATYGSFRWNEDAVCVGQVYTVRRCFVHEGLPTLWLDEIKRSEIARLIHGADVGYAASRFRPVTDISIFTNMLNQAPVPVS